MSQEEYFGFNSIDNLSSIINKEKARKVLIICGKNSFSLSGAEKEILERLKDKEYLTFSNYSPNPKIEEINEGLKIAIKFNPDIIIGVGGGSSIDVAKAIKLFYFKSKNIFLPLIAIPTTAGTGSEATYFIVYYKNKEKISDGSTEITLPEYSICDPIFLSNISKEIAAPPAMDALGQAIESYWNVNSTNQSKKYSSAAIKLIIKNIEKAILENNDKAKENLLLASNLSGKAINITKTTACHSISYPFTSYFGIQHGHAVGLTLGSILEYNSKLSTKDCLDKRGEKYVKKTINEIVSLLSSKDVHEAKNKISEIMNKIGLKTKLSQLGLKKSDLKIIIENGFSPERIKNNPRAITKEDLEDILLSIY